LHFWQLFELNDQLDLYKFIFSERTTTLGDWYRDADIFILTLDRYRYRNMTELSQLSVYRSPRIVDGRQSDETIRFTDELTDERRDVSCR
jgi:hypothetical protein